MRQAQPRNATEMVLIFNGLRDPITVQDVDGPLSQNPRKIKFPEIADKEVTMAGSGGRLGGPLFDPWGAPYGYCFDNGTGGEYFQAAGWPQASVPWRDEAGYDHLLPTPFPAGGGPNRIDAECPFFSNGPDTRTGTGPSKPKSASSPPCLRGRRAKLAVRIARTRACAGRNFR